jgi:hypothetical protein
MTSEANLKKNAEILIQKFGSTDLLKKPQILFRVYSLERNKSVFEGENTKYQLQPFLTKFNICFVAEAAVELSPRGGGGIVQHIFQLDLDQLKIEATEIYPKKDKEPAEIAEKVDNLIEPDKIADILEEKYCDFTEFLVDYNEEKDNYYEIARLIIEYRGTAGAKRFRV